MIYIVSVFWNVLVVPDLTDLSTVITTAFEGRGVAAGGCPIGTVRQLDQDETAAPPRTHHAPTHPAAPTMPQRLE